MKKLALALTLALVLSGCSNGLSIASDFRETESIKLVSTVAVDVSEDGVTVTALTSSGDGGEAAVFTAEAPTLAEAVGALEKNSLKYDAVFSHTDFIVVGEPAAERGIADILDYVARAKTMRLGTKLFIAAGSAQKLVTTASGRDSSASDMLASLVRDAPYASGAAVTSCGDCARSLAEAGCALVRMVRTEKSGELSPEEEYTAIVPDGFAVLTDGKLTARIPQEDDAAIGLLTGTMKSGYDTVRIGGAWMTLLLDSYSVSAVPEINGGALSFRITAELRENVTQDTLPADVERSDVRDAAEREISEKTRLSLEKAIADSQEIGDYLHLYRLLSRKAPVKMARLGDWNEAFQNARFTVEVAAQIGRTYDLASPLDAGGGDGE